MKLTFQKEGVPGCDSMAVVPYTEDGEPVENVISCTVESAVQSLSCMTLKVHIREGAKNDYSSRDRDKS